MHKRLVQSGYSLIELMITIAIGSFLILGAAYAFQEARKTYVTNDNVARLYEQAQFAVDLLEDDIRLSNFWGLHNKRSAVYGDSNDTLNPSPVAVTGIAGDCANQWAIDLRRSIDGSNEGVPPWASGTNCAQDHKLNTDTLVIRHAGTEIIPNAALDAGQLYIRSDEAALLSQLFMGNFGPPASLGPNAQNFEYLAHGYFIANNSKAGNDGIPTLMRETLVDGGTGTRPIVETQEIIRGVEDFQIQFGVDFDSKGAASYGVIDRYVNPDASALFLAPTRILSVRFWLVLRSEQPELGYINDNTYDYATSGLRPNKIPNDGFRRLVVSKTINIRNEISFN